MASSDSELDSEHDESNMERYTGTGLSMPPRTVGSGQHLPGGGEDGANAGRWTAQEHALFLSGLEKYGKEWKKISHMIKSRTVVQIRTHAQKYFQRLSRGEKDDKARSLYGGNVDELRERKRLRVRTGGGASSTAATAPEYVGGGLAHSHHDLTGGVTPRTVAAATILLAPRYQGGGAGNPEASEWVARHQPRAAAILAKRTSPRLADYPSQAAAVPNRQWPAKPSPKNSPRSSPSLRSLSNSPKRVNLGSGGGGGDGEE